MNVNGVNTNAESYLASRNQKHNFYLMLCLYGIHTNEKKVQSRINQIEPLNSHELLETSV